MDAIDTRHPSYDAVVVGARCAGAATAMLLARRGLRVLVVDRGRPGTDTLSTHALMWGAVAQLDRWGLLPRVLESGSSVVRTTTFHYEDEVVRIPLKPRGRMPGLVAPRRYVLDAVLADAAEASGAERLYGVRLAELVWSGSGRVCGVVLEDTDGRTARVGAGVVIGADGLNSTVARHVRAEAYRTGRHASGVVYGYYAGLAEDGYHWHFRPGSSVGVIPTNDGLHCVFTSVTADRFRAEMAGDIAAGFEDVLEECSADLFARIGGAERTSRLHGFAGVRGFMRQSFGPGWALVGDAGYFKDPITAHGITDALQNAELLARAVAQGSDEALGAYQESRDSLATSLFEVTDEIASYQWDVPTVQKLHLALSDEMKREVREMDELLGAKEVPELAVEALETA